MEASSKKMTWTGRVLSGLAILFLTFDVIMKFITDKMPPEALANITSLGWTLEQMPMVGIILAVCLLFYVIPKTSILGAVLLTGYLGGAVATHLRVGNPLFSHTLFPIYVALFVWGGLYLRDSRLKGLC